MWSRTFSIPLEATKIFFNSFFLIKSWTKYSTFSSLRSSNLLGIYLVGFYSFWGSLASFAFLALFSSYFLAYFASSSSANSLTISFSSCFDRSSSSTSESSSFYCSGSGFGWLSAYFSRLSRINFSTVSECLTKLSIYFLRRIAWLSFGKSWIAWLTSSKASLNYLSSFLERALLVRALNIRSLFYPTFSNTYMYSITLEQSLMAFWYLFFLM